MEFYDLIKNRFSTRDFNEISLSVSEVEKIINAILFVPTSRNKQTQRIKVLTEKSDLKKIDLCTPCRYNSKTVIIVGYDRTISQKSNGIETGIVDASITSTYLMQRAFDIGVDSVWVGNFNMDELVKLFVIPSNIVPLSLLMLGHRKFSHLPADSHFNRNGIEIFFF